MGQFITGGEYKTYYESELAWYKKVRKSLIPLTDINGYVHEKVFQNVLQLKKYEKMFNPVLTHGDPTPSNIIVKKNGEVILIDWDNAGSGIWISEYAGLTFRGAYMWQYSTEDERNKIIKRSFKNFYKGVDFDDPEIVKLVQILQIIKAYYHLAVHYFQHEDLELYSTAKKRLLSMLNLQK